MTTNGVLHCWWLFCSYPKSADKFFHHECQIDDIASSNPRLVATAVTRGSWLVKACHYTRIGCD